jgi:hypothetical protein
MTTDKKQEKLSGRTYIKDDTIVWVSDEGLVTQIPIKGIKIIGEYTTSAGPLFDDWYFVFITNPHNIKQVPAYATGVQEMLVQLGGRLNSELSGQLANSADWKTNVLWPTSLRGQELFGSTEREPNGTWEKIKAKVGLSHNNEIELTDTLKKYLS